MNRKIPSGKRPMAQNPPRRTSRPAATPAAAAADARRPVTAAGFACQDDQAPAPSLDATWADLHPARIWPD
ncbi:MAG: hypothetical protein ACOY5W_06190 [Pseudomonadota bacterium]